MTWLWVILIVALIGGLIGYFSSDKNKGENALGGAVAGGMGCGYIILQIFLALVGIWLLIKLGSWLFS
ncbi:MAG TPA: hypothetical protein PLE74_11060 [Candidatus Cloacimonadota bacterium]|nr:hypothetical protein [Candidatus Cloacimonadota bacterium]